MISDSVHMDEDSSPKAGEQRHELVTGTGRRPRLPELTPKAMWATAAAITVLTAGAVVGLWWAGTRGLTGAELVTARLDALKIGLSIGVGSGGVVALYLGWRRQRSTEADLDHRERTLNHQQQVAADTKNHQERVLEETRLDGAERRITELYARSADQLGSDKAPVRLAGLYALERLAQNNPGQRQSIVNVVCAYLRMPFTLPDAHGDETLEQVQEREVRLAAQRILTGHLQPEQTQVFWADIDIDLANALLINFAARDCRFRNARFNTAIFTGIALFRGTTFTGEAVLSDASFTGPAWFSGATFIGEAAFGGAVFTGSAVFSRAAFASDATFYNVTFASSASFRKATFTNVSFRDATFTRGAAFDGATLGETPFVPPEVVPRPGESPS